MNKFGYAKMLMQHYPILYNNAYYFTLNNTNQLNGKNIYIRNMKNVHMRCGHFRKNFEKHLALNVNQKLTVDNGNKIF